MGDILADIVQQQRAERFAGIRGAVLQGRLPVRETLLQPLLKEAVRQSNGKVQQLTLAIEDANMLTLDLGGVSLLLFRQDIRLRLRIDPVVDFAVNPVLKIHIVDTQGIPGFALDFLLNLLPFPESITVMPKMLLIDLKKALTGRKLDEFVPLIKRLSLSTRRGCALIDFHLAVD